MNDTAIQIQCRGLGRRLRSGDQDLTILKDVNLEIERGSCVVILGPSGSGKSTLLGLLAGLDEASEGEVLFEGQELGSLDEGSLARIRRGRIGFVFQNFQLIGNLTARENVLLPMELTGMAEAAARADSLLDAVGLEERGHHYPSQLSGGEQQRVAIARAFGPRPGLLLADEPTGNLDRKTGAQILELMFELRRESGTTLILVTHDPEVAKRADRVLRFEDGRLLDADAGAAR